MAFEVKLGLNASKAIESALPFKQAKPEPPVKTIVAKKEKRKGFSKRVKEKTLKTQDYQCYLCDEEIAMKNCHFHHKDENPGNNKAKNCIALCPGCHDKVNRRGIVFK
jgi:5-methylcytosine-specific restriction endonuclease McrA